MIETAYGEKIYTNETDLILKVLGFEKNEEPKQAKQPEKRTYQSSKIEKSDGGYKITYGNSVSTVGSETVRIVLSAINDQWRLYKEPYNIDELYKALTPSYSKQTIDRALRGLIELDKDIQRIGKFYFPREITGAEKDEIRKKVSG